MSAATQIFADLTNQELVQSSVGGSQKPLSSPFHQDKLYFSVQPLAVNPTGSQNSTPYQTLDAATFSLTILITKTDGTTLAGPVTSFAVDGTAKAGSVDLNTVAMATAFASVATLQIDAYAFFQFDDGANVKTTIQAPFTILRNYITAGTPSELPLASYPTWDQVNAIFVKFRGNAPGSSIELTDTNNVFKNVLFTDSTDGSFKADPES